jgi:hypothetical protein
MSMLNKLFANKAIKNAMLGQFESIVKSEGLKTIVINIDEHGKMLEPLMFNEETITIKKAEYDNLINTIQKSLQ